MILPYLIKKKKKEKIELTVFPRKRIPSSESRTDPYKTHATLVVVPCEIDMIAYFTYLPHKGLDSTGTTVGLVKSDLPDDLVTVFPFFFLLAIAIYLTGLRSERTCGAS